MNQAKTIHANWVKRDLLNKSLLYSAHIDARGKVQLEVEDKARRSEKKSTKKGERPQRDDEARGGRFRPTQKILFLQRLQRAKRTRQLKVNQVLRSRLSKGLLL